MDFKKFDTLILNGKTLKGKEIFEYTDKAKASNVRAIGAFFQEWLADEPYLNLHTSGSTGTPKTIKFRKEQLLESALMTATFFNFKKNQNVLLCLPVEYIAAKMMIVRALLAQQNIITIEPGLQALKDFNTKQQIDFVSLIPSQIKDINPDLKIDKILLGGAPVSEILEKQLQNLPYAIYHSYGMTETLSHIAIRKINGENASTTYQALEGIEIGIDNRDCLWIKVPFIEEEIQTNDVVELVGNNNFLWKGRYDNVIISGGLKFFPESIEEKISDILSEVYYITGIPDERLGEKIVLFIESSKEDAQQQSILKEQLKQKLSHYEVPKEIIYLQKFARTASGKIIRTKTGKD
ncbi:MAG TPA: AMP-binding protein [Edaphocola sp.]|nr:AMP-binding protein [Edaphocola sp.]